MKILLLAIMLVAGVAQAQHLVPGNGNGHGPGSGNHGHHGGNGGYLVPGNGNSNNHGNNHNNNNHHNPYEPSYPSHPGYGDYGPAYTYRWLDMGTTKVEKFANETIRLHVGHRLVNEVLLRSSQADTQIIRAYARLSNGRTTNITTGIVREGQEVRVRLDYQYSVRVESIELVATSQNLIGSRARLQIFLGLAE